MNNFIKGVGKAFIMMIAGLCPMILGAVYHAFGGRKYESMVMSVSLLIGAFLCALVVKRQYRIDVKNYIKKPKVKTSLLVVITALAYEFTLMLTVYNLEKGGEVTSDAVEWVAAVVLAPVAEEFTFRFSMLSVLLLSLGISPAEISTAKKVPNILKKAAAISTISVMWSAMHFSAVPLRIIDIIIVGILLGCIFIKYQNIFYCIFFHAAANFAVAIPDDFFLENEYILYISIPLLLICIFILFFSDKKEQI